MNCWNSLLDYWDWHFSKREGGTMTRRQLVSWIWNRILQMEFKKSFIKGKREPNEIVNVHQILWGTKEVFHRFLGEMIEVTGLECGH